MTGRQAAGRLTALCCRCGRVRTVSAAYNGPRKRYASGETWQQVANLRRVQVRHGVYLEHQPGWRCLLDLKCATCNEFTAHAYIREDDLRDHAEEQDRRVDRGRRRVARRLAGLEGTGVRVVLKEQEQLQVEDAPVEVVEYDDTGLEVRVCLTAPPDRLLECMRIVEEYVDDCGQLGPWQQGRAWRWRGVALTGG